MMVNQLDISAESLRTFENFYQKRVSEAGGAREDHEELEIAKDILAAVVNDGLTPTADGGASYVRRGAVDWADPATLQAAQAAVGSGSNVRTSSKKGKQGRKDLFQGLGVVVLALLAIGWFFWPSRSDKNKTQDDVALAADRPGQEKDGGLFVPTPTPVPTLESELLADIVEAGTKTKQLVVPRTLEIKGVSFVVQPVKVGVGDWPPPEVERAVSWVYGTVINYVMGLEGTPANKELLASLQPGNQLLLRMSTGVVYRFVYADTVRVAPQASEIFWQTRPSLTLVLLGDEAETRVVIRALYVPDSDLAVADKSPVTRATPGQRVVLDDKVRLTYLGSQLVPAPETLRGYAYLGVNAVVEYVGGDLPLLTTSFMHHIEIEGLLYPMVSADGAVPHPALPESLSPRQPFTTTIVYAVPDHVLRQEMRWQFAANPAEGERVQVIIPPFDGELTPQLVVKNIELDNGVLVLVLEIKAALHNLTLQPTDITVQGGHLSPIGNYFPWRIPTGETDEFILLLSPDGNGQVVVTLLEQGIEVTMGE
ncbi:MAG: hypothetical protein KDJ65_00300 [Anaerolineae bacterium]|nr:hypothetical protein [Anaerolineae bacterium]